MAVSTSQSPEISLSGHPPAYPASIPSALPPAPASTAAPSPTRMLTSAPRQSCAAMSMPRSSVPRMCRRLGDSSDSPDGTRCASPMNRREHTPVARMNKRTTRPAFPQRERAESGRGARNGALRFFSAVDPPKRRAKRRLLRETSCELIYATLGSSLR